MNSQLNWICSQCWRPNLAADHICHNCAKWRWQHLGLTVEEAEELTRKIEGTLKDASICQST